MVESLINASYAAANMPGIQTAARGRARQVLTQLLASHLGRSIDSATCSDFSSLVDLAIYSHALFPGYDARIRQIVALSNAAYHACGSLQAAIGYDYHQKLADEHVSTEDVWDLMMWSITFTEAQLVPGLEVPAEARDLPPAFWHFFTHYPLVGART